MAVWMDLQSRRISNRLIVCGLLLGYVRNLSEYGWKGNFYFFLQVSVPIIMLYLLFLMRAFGAGDIKLFSVVSCCIGLEGFFQVFVYSFLAGAVLALLLMLRNRNLYARLHYFFSYVRMVCYTKAITAYQYESDGKQNYLHFSIAILAGYIFYLGGM